MAPQFEGIKNPAVNNHKLKDDIVISGISGRLPKSNSIEEFKNNLLEGIDCITEDTSRWPEGCYNLPKRFGTIPNLKSFDSSFFGIAPRQGNVMDPQLRTILELTHEAVVDAGYNPVTLRGSRTAVFVALSFVESENFLSCDLDSVNGYVLLGCCHSMYPNRISYSFDFRGPSMTIDTGYSSSLYALHLAINAINNGDCDAAIIGGVNLINASSTFLQLQGMEILSQDGTTKSFDADGKGYVRSDAMVVLFLQKSSVARRVYATVLKSKANMDGYKNPGVGSYSGEMQSKLMRELYDESGINPANISYVEAVGIGTVMGDSIEGQSIENVFCKNRKEPLLIGSVTSNMGHSEAASGLCSILKVLIAMENGVIPPNLHYKTPNSNIPALLDGRLKVVDTLTPWNGGLVAINSYSVSGANAHIVLRSNAKLKSSSPLESKLPKLVTVSGRTLEAIKCILDAARVHKEDAEFISLLHNVQAVGNPLHFVRGYEILNDPESREISDFNVTKRPIWFVFAGMGSQWEGMGRELLCIDSFRNSLERCAAVLKSVGIDLMDIILHGTDDTFYNIENCFVAIAAIQIGLVDLLTLLGIEADGIVGHSFGELGCAYADGTFTTEQTLLSAYWRGKAVLDSDSPPGGMAAIGLGWEEASKRCPSGVYPVCHNSADTVTISGPIDPLHKFVKDLQSEGIFAKVVNSSGYAFHSKYIKSAAPTLRVVMDKLIPNPIKRSSKWISSSVPQKDWDSELAKFSSGAYHVNNLLSPVLFHDAIAHIPYNAITIEIAPHCLLQGILSRSLPSTVTKLALHKRNHKNNINFFLNNIGKLYNVGAYPQILNLYPPVTYPVRRGTPMLNSLVKWDHSAEWSVCSSSNLNRSTDNIIEVDLSQKVDNFISGHKIDGRILFPAAGYIMFVWKIFAKSKGQRWEKTPIICEDVHFHRDTVIPKGGLVKFMVNVFLGNEDFEISENGSVVVTGKIRSPKNIQKEQLNLPHLTQTATTEVIELTTVDIYKKLRLCGYDYNGAFQGIKKADDQGIIGEIDWCNNWILFMDSMFQFEIFGNSDRGLSLPNYLQSLYIDPEYHMKLAHELPENNSSFPIYNYKNINCLKSGGIEIRHLKLSLVPREQQIYALPNLERYTFIPYKTNQKLGDDSDTAKLRALSVLSQIVCENIFNPKLNMTEIAGERKSEALLIPHVLEILRNEPIIKNVDAQLITSSPDNYRTVFDNSLVQVVARDINTTPVGQDLDFILGADLLTKKSIQILQNVSVATKCGGFVMLEESRAYDKNLLKGTDLTCVATQLNSEKIYVLLKKIEKRKEPIVIEITENNFSWLENVKAALKKATTKNQELLLVSEGSEISGIIGFMNCLRFENGGVNARYVLIQDNNAPKFSLTTPFYEEQLRNQVVANVLKGGQWGSYRHLRLELRNDVPSLQVKHAFVDTLVRGDLTGLRWIESSLSFHHPDNHSDTGMCSVYYASLNFKDIMLATGKLSVNELRGNMASEECVMGFEFSGRDSKGRRIMGMVPARGLATTVLADPLFTWEVPDKWSLEDAATIPVAYATSYYALFVRGRLRPNHSVLIHEGSSGVGQASIAIALHRGCKVFTTVECKEHRNLLKATFPQLTDKNIGSSTDASFEDLIMEETNSCGVNVILNSLSKVKFQATIRCLALNGCFLDMDEYNLEKSSTLGMSIFLKNSSYHNIFMDSVFNTTTSDKEELVQLVSEGITNGAIRPLSRRVYDETQILPAFKSFASGKHTIKILLKIRNEEAQKIVAKPSRKTVTAIPRTYMDPNKSYILIGGLGGFGLELANWMIGRGAKHIVLTSRSGIRTGYQTLYVRRWRKSGVNVVISTTDCTTLAGAEELIKESNKIAPVGGIFNLAVILNDGFFENLNENHFKMVILPKIDVTKNLDTVSRKCCPSLDYFVVFSSLSSGRGNPGQTNYGLANSAMERIVERRRSNGLPGLAIQWGAIGDLTTETMEDNEPEIGGILPQCISNCLLTMDMCLQQLHPVVSSMILAKKY